MTEQTVLINRLSEVISNYDAFIFAYSGVVSDGNDPYPAAGLIFQKIREQGKYIIVLGNTVKRTKQVQIELDNYGISSNLYDGVLTSGEVAYHELASKQQPFFKDLGTCYYHIGKHENKNDWVDIGYIPVDDLEKAEFIIASSAENKFDSIERYLPILREAAASNIPMLCVDPGKTLMLPGSDNISAGAIASRYEAMGGVVMMRGKPQADLFLYCIEGLQGIDKSRILMVANSYPYDIKGASDVGIDSLLIGSGTHARELGLLLSNELSLKNVDELSRHYGFAPTFVTNEIKF